MSGKIKINTKNLEKICRKKGIETDIQLAKILDMDRGSIYRAKKLEVVGSEFIAKTMIRLHLKFDDLFEPIIEE